MNNVTYGCLLFCGVMVAVAASSFAAQTTAPSLAKELAATWDRAATDILEIAEAMPEEKYDFKPVPEVYTFREQIVHLSGIVQRFIDTAKGTKTEAEHKTMTKAEAIGHLKQTFQTGKEMFASLTDAQMLEQVKPVRGDQMVTRYGFWVGPLQGFAYHHGQLVIYLRLNDIVPPATARRTR
ncbi:MAG TPA: DinB family protein [Candidatus Tectomicrobia bacterium]|nr:DinB family protein [Candidatus Tectomicrobia bacterium]